MKMVLLYNINGKKAIDIKLICHKLRVPFAVVSEGEYGYKLSQVLGLSSENSCDEGESFTEEMLYIYNLTDYELDKFLSQLRRKKATVSLKAAATETNLSYNSYELYKEISAEHKAMQNGENLHNQT
ncbi:MAG: DUF3783 domain-containing protein [Ruminococcus sp.]|nr:DUF3783 domain-containing protein [Ruminococcus sp.]